MNRLHSTTNLNEEALDRLRCEKRREIVPGASLFEEPGTLDVVAKLATWWFGSHLERAAHPAAMLEP